MALILGHAVMYTNISIPYGAVPKNGQIHLKSVILKLWSSENTDFKIQNDITHKWVF